MINKFFEVGELYQLVKKDIIVNFYTSDDYFPGNAHILIHLDCILCLSSNICHGNMSLASEECIFWKGIFLFENKKLYKRTKQQEILHKWFKKL